MRARPATCSSASSIARPTRSSRAVATTARAAPSSARGARRASTAKSPVDRSTNHRRSSAVSPSARARTFAATRSDIPGGGRRDCARRSPAADLPRARGRPDEDLLLLPATVPRAGLPPVGNVPPVRVCRDRRQRRLRALPRGTIGASATSARGRVARRVRIDLGAPVSPKRRRAPKASSEAPSLARCHKCGRRALAHLGICSRCLGIGPAPRRKKGAADAVG